MKSFGRLVVWLAIVSGGLWWGLSKVEKNSYPILYPDQVIKASDNYHIPRNLILAVIREESHFNLDSHSRAGAEGLMQLLPTTAEWIAQQKSSAYSADRIREPDVNIDFGSWYISYLRQQFNDDTLAIEAYNAGITNVVAWQKENPNTVKFAETDNFVKRVKKSKEKYDQLYGSSWEKR